MSLTRRSSFAAFAAFLAAPILAPAIAHAQGATTGPAGGVPSTTAPSNQEGTPAGGSGIVGGSSTSGMPSSSSTPLAGGQMGTSETTHRTRTRRHRRRHRHHAMTTTPTAQ